MIKTQRKSRYALGQSIPSTHPLTSVLPHLLTFTYHSTNSLRRRFAQNQEDCTFTVLALLPTLGDQLFSKHNVEQLTESLRSQAPPAIAPPLAQLPESAPSAQEQQHPSESEPSQSVDQASQQTASSDSAAASAETPSIPANLLATEASEASHRADAPSPQLNPLARSFVPGNFASASNSSSEAKPVPNGLDPASKAEQERTAVDASEPNGDAEPHNLVSPDHASTAPTFAEVAAKPAEAAAANAVVDTDQASEAALVPAQPENSHLDAQEQRAKILAERQAKLRLWNELKLTAFTRSITSLYCVVLLTLQTHIQLNLIGRFAYLASVEALANDPENAINPQSASLDDLSRGLDHDTERLYLTFSWWFLHQGWQRLSDRVSIAIEKAFSPLSVKAQLSMADLRALLNDARYLIEHDAPAASHLPEQPTWKRSNFLDILFPNSTDEEVDVLVGAGALDANSAQLALATNDKLRALLDETKDIIESQDFGTILALCIDRVFETFFDSLNPTFGIQKTGKLDSTVPVEPLSALESRFQEITEEMQHGKRVRLASLFPLVSRQSQMAIRGVPNEYIEALADSKELRAFSAVLYAAWSSL